MPHGSLPSHITRRGYGTTELTNARCTGEEQRRDLAARQDSKLPIKPAAVATLPPRRVPPGNHCAAPPTPRPGDRCAMECIAAVATPRRPSPLASRWPAELRGRGSEGASRDTNAVITFLHSYTYNANNYRFLQRNGKSNPLSGRLWSLRGGGVTRQFPDELSPPYCNSGEKTGVTCAILATVP